MSQARIGATPHRDSDLFSGDYSASASTNSTLRTVMKKSEPFSKSSNTSGSSKAISSIPTEKTNYSVKC
ncbi:hypothetical protein [Halorussus caseinilyticus]|uniref:hypothetical protein n=1 Tax=Halorussus caseinilyticus TaxID=3034025 RepID=UPI0023E854CD|nr:hypothetical protein [Halorussus sp. DT72]